jgi:hypothetical protein
MHFILFYFILFFFLTLLVFIKVVQYFLAIKTICNSLFLMFSFIHFRDSAARWIASPGDDGKSRVHEAVSAVSLLIRRYFPGTVVYPIGELIAFQLFYYSIFPFTLNVDYDFFIDE